MNETDKKFEEIKAYYKQEAKNKEKQLHMDLWAVRHEYVPHHLKKKFLSGCAIFGLTYLVEHAIFGKKLPFTVKFVGALASTVMVPKVYRKLEDKLLGVGEMQVIEMETLEDQQGTVGYQELDTTEEKVIPATEPDPAQEVVITDNNKGDDPDENIAREAT
ncbi:MAG: hypothetical protein ACLFUB_18640 [Cyclobacteriaceae bacterium]